MESGMVEAGAMFACLMGLIKIIEKLVDQKFNKNGKGSVQIDLKQTEIANQMGSMTECLAATGQTLERINDRMDTVHEKITRIETITDNINRVTTKTGATAFEIRDALKDEALERAAEARGAAKALASKIGD
jgi:methyl-accepting chemotaxis protein